MGISEGSPVQTNRTAYAKVLRQEQDWQVEKTARRPVWLEQSEQGLEGLGMMEPRSGQSKEGLGGHSGFYSGTGSSQRV